MNDHVTASTRPRTASARLARRRALLDERQDRLRDGRFETRQGSRLDPVEADDAHHLLDEVGFALDVRAPGWGVTYTCRPNRRHDETELLENAIRLRRLTRQARQTRNLRPREVDDPVMLRHLAGHHDSLASPPQIASPCWWQDRSRKREGGIDTALEPIARIGDDTELSAGLRDVERVPESGFDRGHPWCFASTPECSPPMMPAMDSTPFSSAITTLPGRAHSCVRPAPASPHRPCAAHGETALDLRASKTCSGRPRSKVM